MTQTQQTDQWGRQKGYEGPQPWDHRAQGVTREQLDEIGSGPNNVTPVVSHGYPILSTGAQGTVVGELARLLHLAGYQTDIGTGANPYSVLTDALLGVVQQFREDHGVREDPSGFGGTSQAAQAKADQHVGPWTWEALLRAALG